ncbi:MAG TPA: MFS transporter [Candidatus Limnocylindrales bacterium]|jgi:MFS family permease|nr:MFS transporter [Candidatus Limnocylindrales bacterium]
MTTAGLPPLVTRTFLILGATSLVFFVAGGVVLPVVAPFATGPLRSDAVGAGLAFGAFAAGALIMRPVVGWAADRFGRRPLLVLGALLSVSALGFHLVVDTLALFIVARALLGIAEAFFFVAVFAAGADLAPESRRGEALNLLSLSLYVGLGIGPAIGEFALGAGGFSAVWIVAIVLTAAAAAMTWLVPETSPTVLRPDENTSRSRLIHPAAIFPGVLILAGTTGMAGFLAFLPLHAASVGMDGAGLPLAIYAALVIGLRLLFAKLPDQVGPARLSGGALAVGAAGLAILGLVPSPAGVLIGTVVFGSGVAFLMPGLLTLAVSRVSEMERGSVVGTASAFLDVAFGLAPAVLGIVAARVGFGGIFLVGAAASAFGFMLLLAWTARSRSSRVARLGT